MKVYQLLTEIHLLFILILDYCQKEPLILFTPILNFSQKENFKIHIDGLDNTYSL